MILTQFMANHKYMFARHEKPGQKQELNEVRQVKVQFSPDEGEHFFVSLHRIHVPSLPFSACRSVHQGAYFSFSLPSSPCSGYAHHLWPSFCFSSSFCLVQWLRLLSSQPNFPLDML